MLGLRAGGIACALAMAVAVAGGVAGAQDMPPVLSPAAPPPTTAAPAPVAAAPVIPAVPVAPAAPKLSQAQLDQLVAPVALYPDPLLGQVLMASTYPLEIVEAAHWVRVPANRGLRAGALRVALKGREWDPSVAALVPFPGLLAIMADRLEWTERLGETFLAQPAELMAAIQQLRRAALAAGNLKAPPECHCIIQSSADIIAILPSDTDLVSVPVYNPTVAYGAWADSTYPPVAFPAPSGFAFAPGIVVGFAPAVEIALYGPLWGWGSIDWADRRIVVDNARYAALAPGHPAFAGGVWIHESTPRHIAAHPAHPRGPARASAASSARRFAMVRPARPTSAPRHHVAGLPPGTIVPPPPPAHHAAIAWPRDEYQRY